MKRPNLNARPGYGLALLMVFLATTVMIGTSLQIMAAPLTIAYLGAASQDNLAAQQLAQTGMNVVVADLQSQYDTGASITTSYSYNSSSSPTSVNMPQSPDALTGATSTVGSYVGSISYINGSSMLVNVTATVGSGSYTYSRVVTLSRNIYPTTNITGATAAYGLRKLNNSYSGSAIRVRRASDNTETDIGFTAAGDLDVDALRQFLGTSKPLDSVSSAGAAFSLRQLRAAYSGSAVRIRRSSDNTEKDIGFDSSGNLDVSTLMDFVGTGSGYVTTWYDQSGNSKNATQATQSLQPILVSSGVLQMSNGRPAIKYDWTNFQYMNFSRPFSGDFAILGVFSVNQGWDRDGSPDNYWFSHDGLMDMDMPFAKNDFGISLDSLGRVHAGMGSLAQDEDYDAFLPSSMLGGKLHWFAMNRQQSTGVYTIYDDNGSVSQQTDTNAVDADTAITIGAIHNGSGHMTNDGYVNEIIVYSKYLSNSELQTLKNDQAYYWGIFPALNIARPLDSVTSAAGAYGLRQLRSGYSGNLIKARCTVGGTNDIGMVAAELDVATLLTYAGSGSCYVTTWYDQSGNGKNMTQATTSKQPMIVNAGKLVTENGKPALKFTSGSSSSLAGPTLIPTGTGKKYTYSAVAMTTQINNALELMGQNASTVQNNQRASLIISIWGGRSGFGFNGEVNDAFGALSPEANKQFQAIMTVDNTVSMNVNVYRDGQFFVYTDATSNYATLSAGTNTFDIGYKSSSNSEYWDGTISEALVYNRVLTATEIGNLSASQLQYFRIPLQKAYVTKWYDQSGNGNDAVQTNPLQQPVLSLGGGDGAAANRPTLLFHGNSAGTSGAFLSASSGFPTNANYTISSVFSYRDITPTNNIVSSAGNTHALYMGGTNTLKNYHTGAFVTSTATLNINTLYAICATYVNSSKLGSLYVGPTTTATGTGTATFTNGNADIRIGAHLPTSPLNGTISEAIVFNKVLSTSDRQYLYRNQTAYYGAQ